MNKITKGLTGAVVLALSLISIPTGATPIVGVVVEDTASIEAIVVQPDGWVEFFIPLNGEETFDGSLTQDFCNSYGPGNNTCTGGTLHMYMYFAADWDGDSTLIYEFEDFDSAGFNDPSYFFELLAVNIVDADGGIGDMSFSTGDIAAAVNGNNDLQSVSLDTVIEGEFYAHLVFETAFSGSTPNSWFGNTLESTRGQVVSVPEPSTFLLFGAGLLFLFFGQLRKGLIEL